MYGKITASFLRYPFMKIYRIMYRLVICAVLAGLVVFSSCRKEVFYTQSDAVLRFSSERITFDTVFTSISTITKVLMVKNPYKGNIKTDITLLGGSASYFSINADGVPMQQQSLKDVEIPAQDSIFIFIKANINPNGKNNPMLAEDTLQFTTNGNKQKVLLLAYGQDAHFIFPNDSLILSYEDGTKEKVPCNIVAAGGQDCVWRNDKPYVIYGTAFVGLNAKLTIEKGTRVYVHKGGMLWVLNGSLEVNGTKDEPVTFQGDRLDNWYDKDYNQWDRIWICESDRDSKINYAVIKNALIGIQAETLDEQKGGKLTLTNSIIKATQMAGLLAKDYTIEASNNIFTESMQCCVALKQGGNYTFVNNTMHNRYVGRQATDALSISNYWKYEQEDGNTIVVSDFSGVFINNIISGSAEKSKFSCDFLKDKAFSATFENCLFQVNTDELKKNGITHTNTLFNKNPQFENETEYNFKLKNTSPCKKAGKSVLWLTSDIEGNPRNSSTPSIGAYE
jgi:hypothetical protein